MNEEPKDIKSIFSEALEKETAKERAAYLDKACEGDGDLRSKVEALLKAHEEAGSFLEVPALDAKVTLDDSPLTEKPGTRIGRYKLLQLIGEGGFGVVYMAEQEKPIRRRVALKIIKLGMDTKQVIARFEAERQALALMDHPNIARVFDAGATDTGRPYFVMELVKGIPITEYCDKNNLDTRQRLDLFIDVCKAVQHAHQKGIIHRDIKPSNVMITLHDGKPVPKIIDFGIAKATQHRLTEKTFFTEYQQFIGTPEYMSPEQAEMTGLDVETRSDIYWLGVLLYELLSGTRPFEGDKLRSAAYDEIRRIIREDEPPKPSTRLNTLGDALTDVAKHRHVQPAQLCKIVRGDLDWVVMKALEKDRTRRYETANEFAQDIGRHLGDEPVVAGPPSMRYQLRKFVRRNRALVTGIAAVLVVLAAGIVVSTNFAIGQARARAEAVAARDEAERQAKLSQAVADFLKNDILASVDPYKTKGREVTVRYVLDAASKSIEGKFEDAPLIEASIRETLGRTYQSLIRYEAAERHLERTLQIRQEKLGEEHLDTLKSMSDLAWLYMWQGRFDESEQLFVKVLEGRRCVLGEEHPKTLDSMFGLVGMYHIKGPHDEAERLYVKILEARRRVLGEEHPDTLVTMLRMGWLHLSRGRFDEAEALLTKALEIGRRVLGEEHPVTWRSMHVVALLYANRGLYDKAEQLCLKSLEIGRRVEGEEHPDVLDSMNNLAIYLYKDQGRFDEAESLLVKVLETSRRLLGGEHPRTLYFMTHLGVLYRDQGRYKEAERMLVKAVETSRRPLAQKHWSQPNYPMNLLIELYEAWGKPEKAEE